MERNRIWEAIELAVRESKKANPGWPDHVIAQSALVTNAGHDLVKSCWDWKYKRNQDKAFREVQFANMENDAIEVAAMAIRFLENLKL